jgi:hypothetical protein
MYQGTYEGVKPPPVTNPNPPAAYGSYGEYPPLEGGYGTYKTYKKE